MNMTTLNRRLFLRGAGGAAVAAPFLSSLHEREAKAQSTAATPPKRLITLFSHYGCLTNRYFPAISHGVLAASDYENTTLKHLASFSDQLLMPRGIRTMNEWTFDRRLGQTNDTHTQVCGSFFSCHPVTPESGKFTAMPTGRTLDHICAEQVNLNGAAPLHIQIGGAQQNAQVHTSYSGAEEMFTGIGSPGPIYNNLTNLFSTDSEEMTPDSYQVAKGNSVIDVIRDDLETLQRKNMSASDDQKLDDWIELLHQTSGKVNAQCNEQVAISLGLTSSSTSGSSGFGLGGGITELMMDLAVLSAICDANRVIFMKFPGLMTFNWDGIVHDKDIHGLSHRTGDAFMEGTCVDGVLEKLNEIQEWYCQKFAYLVGRLNDFDEGDGTILDNSATIWFQEMSDGNAHNLNNAPIIQAGSCGGYFKTGQAVNVEDEDPDLTRGNSEGLCTDGAIEDFGFLDVDTVGSPEGVANAPINKYYCNLMNAIGVKAGADGFAAIGGTYPVTKFGKYDETSMFSSDAETTISNPEEFAALRANS
jgi:hypothetical protein